TAHREHHGRERIVLREEPDRAEEQHHARDERARADQIPERPTRHSAHAIPYPLSFLWRPSRVIPSALAVADLFPPCAASASSRMRISTASTRSFSVPSAAGRSSISAGLDA